MMTTAQLRSAFLNYFAEQGHTIVASASLLPQGDPSLMFVNSGMVPFKDCFRGTETRPYKRATTCQKSLRVSGKHNDYEQIGQTARHHTFFEMLGNFSLGDYFKEDAIRFAWQLITEKLSIPKEYLWVTVHHTDKEAEDLWQQVAGVPAERIIQLGDETNLWAMGDYGPRGYSSEIFYYMGDKPQSQSREEFLKDDGTYLEIWNLVFMQFNRNLDGSVTPLPKPCIDTGAGLERMAAVLQGVKSNFDTDEIRSLIREVETLSGIQYDGSSYDRNALSPTHWAHDVAMRVIADHSRSIAFLIADGVIPSNEKEGYVLRRLIRRATLRGETLGIQESFLSKMTAHVGKLMGSVYPELIKHADRIRTLVAQEEGQFRKTLAGGLKLLTEASSSMQSGETISGDLVFKMHDTFGFPLDLTEDVLKERGITVDRSRFDFLMAEQKDRSRGATKTSSATAIKDAKISGPQTEFVGYDSLQAESLVQAVLPASDEKSSSELFYIVLEQTPFYAEMGGQIGDRGTIQIGNREFDVLDTQKTHSAHFVHLSSPRAVGKLDIQELVGQRAIATVDSQTRSLIAQNHSGTHLLGAALRTILGPHVEQRGSLVSAEGFRFDFTHPEPVSPEKLEEVQALINSVIRENHRVTTSVLPIREAKDRGAVAVFGEKYGEMVRLVEMGPLSIELCGGTHVASTGDIGTEILVSEGSVAAGIRRIEGLSGPGALAKVEDMQNILRQLSAKTKGSIAEIPTRFDAAQKEIAELNQRIKERDEVIATFVSNQLISEVHTAGDAKNLVAQVDISLNRDALMLVAEKMIARIGKGSVVIGQPANGLLVAAVSKDNTKSFEANVFVKSISQSHGGKGGGKPQLASLVEIPRDKFADIFSSARAQLGLPR